MSYLSAGRGEASARLWYNWVPLLSVNNISMRFGARILFEDVSCAFLTGRRYAISGPNGAGKTTLMKILTGEIEPSKGDVTRPKKLGVLSQDQFAFDEFRVIDTVIMGNKALWKALQERDALYEKPHDQLTDKDGMRLAELEGIVGEEGGYTAEADAGVLLDGLDVDDTLHERKMGELPGRKFACCWRKLCLEVRRRCCWTSRPTTWTWIQCTGCRIICASTKAC